MAADTSPAGEAARPVVNKTLERPDVPRDNLVPSKERPQGHYATPPGRTPLQQHLDFFDINKDGVIMPWETFLALRFLKFAWEPFNSIISFWVAAFFHVAFAWPSQRGFLPHPLFPIVTKNAMSTVHGSSSGAIDQYGYFVPARFEAIWSSYDRQGRGRLSLLDVLRLVWDKAHLNDPFGTFATGFQWLLTWWLFRDDADLLRKNDIRGLYDGTAFYRLADRNGNPWYGMAKRRDAVKNQKLG